MPAAGAVILRAESVTRTFAAAPGLRDLLRRERPAVRAVDAVNLEILKGEVFGIVGESGSGKSTLGRLLLGLLPATEGHVHYGGDDLAQMNSGALMRFRRRAQVVFQDPYSALDPRMSVAAQIREPLDIHRIGSPAERAARVSDLLERVGLGAEFASARPSELSGGQRQRVGIAIALASEPEIIVADEPTSALDVSVQAQVLNLLAGLQRDGDLTLVFITHDLGVVQHFCDRVAVMYLGRIVELAEVSRLFADPQHPYTQMLFSAIPDHDPGATRRAQLPRGDPPSPLDPPSGCAFHPRCPRASARCAAEAPVLSREADHHFAACFHPGAQAPETA